MMRAVPCQGRAFDVAGANPGHLGVVVMLGPGGTAWARRHLHIAGLPLPVIPLPDESTPVLDVQRGGAIADAEISFLIAVDGGRQDVSTVVLALRQLDALPIGNHSIGCAVLRRRQMHSRALALKFQP